MRPPINFLGGLFIFMKLTTRAFLFKNKDKQVFFCYFCVIKCNDDVE